MARYGSGDDPEYPDDAPTAYGGYGDPGQGYDQTQGQPYGDPGYGQGYQQDPEQPWYRKPAALVAFGAVGALLVALVVYGLVRLVAGDEPTTGEPSLTPLTTTSRAVAPPPATTPTRTVTQTVTATTTAPVTTPTTTATTTV
ncbi:hypothetical protein, partial [Mycolicibacterium hassiacum]|uniref:hypothetical protein n=1 Tax=Mycolicibacterium hassiacum TaxID=46351 RepID=UPI0023F93A1B